MRNPATELTFDAALSVLKELAAHHGLQLKTYCLVHLGCSTVPEALAKVQALHIKNPLDPRPSTLNHPLMIDPRTPEDFHHLPKFLIAEDNNPDEMAARDFVIHCHYPRFIMEFTNGEGVPTFIDDQIQFIQSELKAGREPTAVMARLLREGGDFMNGAHDDSRN